MVSIYYFSGIKPCIISQNSMYYPKWKELQTGFPVHLTMVHCDLCYIDSPISSDILVAFLVFMCVQALDLVPSRFKVGERNGSILSLLYIY